MFGLEDNAVFLPKQAPVFENEGFLGSVTPPFRNMFSLLKNNDDIFPLPQMNILVQEYRCSGGTETANPAAGNRCSETGIPHLVTSYLCEFTRLKLDLIHILPAWTCNYLGLSG